MFCTSSFQIQYMRWAVGKVTLKLVGGSHFLYYVQIWVETEKVLNFR